MNRIMKKIWIIFAVICLSNGMDAYAQEIETAEAALAETIDKMAAETTASEETTEQNSESKEESSGSYTEGNSEENSEASSESHVDGSQVEATDSYTQSQESIDESQSENQEDASQSSTEAQSEATTQEQKDNIENADASLQVLPITNTEVYYLPGDKTNIKVECIGEDLQYRWYYSKDGDTWNTCQYEGYRTSCLSFSVLAYQFNYQFRCKITDAAGAEAWSDIVTLKCKPAAIMAQPVDCSGKVGETAQFSISAMGYKLNYRWYYSKDLGNTWNTCQYNGYRTSTLQFPIAAYQFNYQFKCKITDNQGNEVWTDAVKLIKDYVFEIVEQPADCSGSVGDTTHFLVTALGDKLVYRWYYSKDQGNTWSSCQYQGYKTNELAFTIKAYHYGYMFKCKITDADKNELETESVTLKIPELVILEQPQNLMCNEKTDAEFEIKTQGYKQKYEWYYSTDSGLNWKLSPFSGRRTSKMTIPEVSLNYNDYQFYCVITNYDGSQVNSEIVTLKVDEKKSIIDILCDDNFESIKEEGLSIYADEIEFKKNVQIVDSDIVSASLDIKNATMNKEDVILLHFTAYADEKCGKLNVSVAGTNKFSGTYLLSTDKTEYIIPVSNFEEINKITFTLTSERQSFHLGNFEVVNYNAVAINSIKTGLFNVDDKSETKTLIEGTGFENNATDIVTDGEYLYAVYRGELTIYSLEDGALPQKIASLTGLGNSRDIAFCKDGKGIAVSARENGVYFIDIENPYQPVLCSNIDSLEMATGITCMGNYAFVCSRYFGVEIYDITDLNNPQYCTLVTSVEEYYDCCVDGEYLYVSSWGQKKVHIYSIKDVYAPVEVATINLNGAGGGCDVEDGYLYVATGYHTKEERKTLASPGYGYGNGLEIYDVSNPESPVWISGTKIDGRYFNSGFDHWRVTVENGYAYLAHTYNGAYIYDVSNAYAPSRVEKITVQIPKSSSKYKASSLGSYIYSYDMNEYQQAIVSDIAVGNGYIYLGSENSGTYVSSFANAQHRKRVDNSLNGNKKAIEKTDISISGYEVTQYLTKGSVYSVYEADGLIYCAAGTAGILVYDADMNLLEQYKTAGVTKDIKVCDGYIYTAESDKGLGVYTFVNGKIEYIARCEYNAYNQMFSYIDILPDKKHLCVQAGWTMCVFVDITNPQKPVLSKTIGGTTKYKPESTGTMYYRNLSAGLIEGKYVGVFDRRNITLYTNDENGNVVSSLKVANTINAEANGVAAWDAGAIAIYNNGYIYMDYASIKNGNLSSSKLNKVAGVKSLQGKASTDGEILVISYNPGRQITILDIADIDNPVLIKQFNVNGNPDIAYIGQDKIFIPLRHGGILELKSVN